MGQLNMPGEPESVTYNKIYATVERLGLGEVKSTRITVYPRGIDSITADIDASKLDIEWGALDPILMVDARITVQRTEERKTIIEVLKIHRSNGKNGNHGAH